MMFSGYFPEYIQNIFFKTGSLITYLGRVTGITGMAFAINLYVIRLSEDKQGVDHSFCEPFTNFMTIHTCMKIKMKSQEAFAPS